MKVLYALIFIFLLTTSCKTEGDLDWLLGQWKRKEHATFETWQKITPNYYTGYNYTISDGDTVNREFLSLNKDNDQWTLALRFEDEKKPTYFKVTDIENNSFTCRNDSNEFPTHIKYIAEQNSLKAIIWNSDLDIKFDFEKR